MIGKRIVVLFIQPESSEMLSIIGSGNTWNFRGRLDGHGVAGAYFSEGSDENKKYYRVMKNIDVSQASQRQRILQLVGERVFKNLALRVVLDSMPDHDSSVSAFVEQLRCIPSLHLLDKIADTKIDDSTKP